MYLFNIKKTISYLRSKIDRLSNCFQICKLIYGRKFQIICRNTLYCFFTNYLFEKKNHDVVDAKKLQILM